MIERPAGAVPCGDQVVVSGEDRCLAIADLVADQFRRLCDDVELVIVDFELGRAQRVHGVVDRQRVEVIGPLKRAEFVGGRVVERDPAEAGAALVQRDAFVERQFPDPFAGVVVVGGQDGHAGLAGMLRPRWTAGRARPRSSQIWTFE